jgi:O-antigen ligase
MYLVPGLILAWWGLWTGENKKQKTGFLLAILILGLALYFTFSYGAWLGLFAAIIFVLFCLRRFEIIDRRQSSIAYCLLLVFTAIIFFTQLNFGGNDKLVSLLTSPRSSWQSRLMVWQSAGKILESHWLIGIGPGLFQKYYLEYQSFFSVPYLEWAVPQPHNLFLAWWLQGGILGLIGFLVLSVTYCKNIILGSPQNNNHFLSGLRCSEEGQRGLPSESKSYPSTGSGNNFLVFSSNLFLDKQKRLLIIFLAAVFVYILIHGLVDTPYWKNDLALVFWSIVSLGYRASRCCD